MRWRRAFQQPDPATSTRQPALLDRDRLVAAAFAQLEEVGLDGLCMRPLASRLGVQEPALYWHVKNKAELLGLMTKAIYATAYASVPFVSDWRSWMLHFGYALRDVFAAHRDGARLCVTADAPSDTSITRRAQEIVAPLIVLGLDQSRALSFQASVISFVLGWASFEANGSMHDYLDQMLDFDASFAIGLQALVKGFEH